MGSGYHLTLSQPAGVAIGDLNLLHTPLFSKCWHHQQNINKNTSHYTSSDVILGMKPPSSSSFEQTLASSTKLVVHFSFEDRPSSPWSLDRFTKIFFWNFQSIQAGLFYILIYKQMLEKAFCSNIAPSLSSGNHLFYKAEYMGQSCPNQVWAITFDWGALAT